MDEAIVRIIKETCQHYKVCEHCSARWSCNKLFPATVTPCDMDVEDLLRRLKE